MNGERAVPNSPSQWFIYCDGGRLAVTERKNFSPETVAEFEVLPDECGVIRCRQIHIHRHHITGPGDNAGKNWPGV